MACCNEDSYNNSPPKNDVNRRSYLFKKPVKRDNYKLESEFDETHQEVRRRQLLDYHRKNRDAILNSHRGITSDILDFENEEEEKEEVEAEMEVDRVIKVKRSKKYANILMMSEWMLEIPQDFVQKWIIVSCPIGKRTLLVARRGKTRAYSRKGVVLSTFSSVLPGGNSKGHRNQCTIIDCIWVQEEKKYYALDVLAWSNQPMLACEAEFRLFWLKSQLDDLRDLQNSKSKTCSIMPIPSSRCEADLRDFVKNLSPELPLDGFLFYHREGQYMKGRTPLVTWLKPYMISEVLGIEVPPFLEEKPDDYIDFNHHVFDTISKICNKKYCDKSMDVAAID